MRADAFAPSSSCFAGTLGDVCLGLAAAAGLDAGEALRWLASALIGDTAFVGLFFSAASVARPASVSVFSLLLADCERRWTEAGEGRSLDGVFAEVSLGVCARARAARLTLESSFAHRAVPMLWEPPPPSWPDDWKVPARDRLRYSSAMCTRSTTSVYHWFGSTMGATVSGITAFGFFQLPSTYMYEEKGLNLALYSVRFVVFLISCEVSSRGNNLSVGSARCGPSTTSLVAGGREGFGGQAKAALYSLSLAFPGASSPWLMTGLPRPRLGSADLLREPTLDLFDRSSGLALKLWSLLPSWRWSASADRVAAPPSTPKMALVRYATSGCLFFLASAGSSKVASGGFTTTYPAGSGWPDCHAKFLLYSACNLLSAGIGQARHRFQKVLIMSLPFDNFFRTPNTSRDGKTQARPGGESAATAELGSASTASM